YDAELPVQDLINQYIREIPPTAELLVDRRINLENATVNRTNVYDWTLIRENDGFMAPGVYYVEFRPQEENGEFTEYPQTYLVVVAGTNLVVKEMVDAVYVWVTDMETGEPLSGRPVTLYDEQGAELGTVISDGNGVARFDYEPQFNYLNGILAVTSTPGADGFGVASSRWSQSVSPWELNIPADTSVEQPTTAYLFTDRPLYRPGDTVYFRGSVRDTDYGRYQLPSDIKQLTLMVQPQRYYASNEEPFSYETNLELDERGNFSGEFELPAEADLGDYGLSVHDRGGNWLGFVNVQVAEFRTPEFAVTMTPSEPEIVRGQPTNVALEANYFFGGSAAGLELYYTVYDASYTLPANLPYSFSDNDSYYFWIDDFYGQPSYYGNYLFEGQGTTDAFGRFTVQLPADLLADVPEGSRRITVEATVFDVNNQPVTSRTNVVYHAADGYVGVAPDNYIGRAGDDNQVNVITVDWQAERVPNRLVEVILYRQEWVRNEETNFWEPLETEVDREQLTTDENGEGSVIFSPDEGGTYRARAVYQDAAGREQKSSTFFWVTGSDAFWRPQPGSKAMQLIPDKTDYTAGETARILVQSPFAGPVQAWLTIERGKLIEQRLVTLQTNSDTLNIPLPAAYAPNVFVSVVAVQGENSGETPYGDIRLGAIELSVAPDPLLLKMTITPNETQYQPQDTAVFDIVITDNNGNPVQTDLALSLVDQAILSLAPDNAIPIDQAFYYNQPYRSQTGASLVLSAEGLEIEIQEADQQTQALGAVAEVVEEEAAFDSAGAPAENRAAEVPAPAVQGTPAPEGGEDLEVRSDFRETAYWEALITTGNDGRATIEIPLPDNLTTWQLNVKAITAETLVGQESSEITVAKPLLLRPITPRFFT
ncbi:MAG: hypothetical protein KDE51_16170, partial [Anaerolineales bacterium]|nr:hypothetical protein [Anaerolineales bacterium]